jgi:ABC-2 type transport system ATP-binding protein
MNADMPPSALSVRNLTVRYEGVPVLDDISFTLAQGAVVGLVGRNGAGKSTLLRCLLSLSLPESGQINVLGDPAGNLTDYTLGRIGYVPQSSDLIDWMTVWEHLGYIGSFYPTWSKALARGLCVRFGLPPDLKVRSLSMGDRKKLAIVLALAHDPDLVLMDEPVASLDPMMRREFMRTLFETERKRTILISSHLLSDLERVVSDIAFIREGRLQLLGGWDDLSENLRIVSLKEPVPEQPGLIAQRAEDSGWRAVVDSRVADMVPYAATGASASLDELFVELNT